MTDKLKVKTNLEELVLRRSKCAIPMQKKEGSPAGDWTIMLRMNKEGWRTGI